MAPVGPDPAAGSAADVPAPTEPRPAAQLAGCVVGLTGHRRAAELAASLERRGATVVHAPTLRIVPLETDDELRAATTSLVRRPPDVVIATTAIGFRGWMEAADTFGLAPRLLAALASARLVARGPKARGAIRAAGLADVWSAESEQTAEVVDRLLADGVAGARIAVQLHGKTDPAQLASLRAAGAEVVEVPVYRWGPAPEPEAVDRLVAGTVGRTVDCVVFTSAPGAEAFLASADAAGVLPDLVEALATDVVAAAVGSITASPLVAAGIPPVVPDRYRLGALVRTVTAELGERPRVVAATVAGRLEVRGAGAVLAGRFVPLPPGPAGVLRALARADGCVVDRRSLLARLPGARDEHAVEVTVARLRALLAVATGPGTHLVTTVVKRGYRLAVAGP